MLILPAVITTREARDTQRMLAQALRQEAKAGAAADGDSRVTVDASGLQQFDSAALAVLLECQRLARSWGKGLSLRGAPQKLVDLATLYGVADLLLPAEPAAEAG